MPATDRDEFMEAVLRVGPGAHLVGEAVLALYRLADVNPRRITIGTPRRARVTVPDTIEVVQRTDEPDDLLAYEGIPTTTVARALLDARATVMTDRLADAAREARDRGLLRRREVERVLDELGVEA